MHDKRQVVRVRSVILITAAIVLLVRKMGSELTINSAIQLITETMARPLRIQYAGARPQ